MLRKTNKKSSFALFMFTFSFYFDIIEKIRRRGSTMKQPKTFTDLFTTTLILIERNPLVLDFNGVESVLQSQFGRNSVSLLDSQISHKQFSLYGGNRNDDYLLPDKEVRMYSVQVGEEVIRLTVKNTDKQTNNKFYVTELFAERPGISLLSILQDKLKKLG